ncbi:GAF domain-containing protein [Teichococcus cervicalis]|uniref:GAF domain protein n=1 Tax=Pseudoroseomonas cervicalis ATCC 49957 TaxID=525371 RepID=D5RJR4_9PROT|nr:GAF domain-containing protein [Pseudoroseomonas cervicalis]EFH12467.1 GAF domain protein [Pseudoroseomonas cervicalis ATCC 49957]
MLASPAMAEFAAAELHQLEAALAETGQPLAALRALEALARPRLGHALCTAMRFDAASMTVQRLYSSDPAAYPPGGQKPKRDTAWGRQVLLEGRPFLGEGEAAIRGAFDDHALILGLGLRSVLNLPIRLGGRCLGTLNFLWREEHVPAGRRATAQALALMGSAAWAA